jgi:hypothetical protein
MNGAGRIVGTITRAASVLVASGASLPAAAQAAASAPRRARQHPNAAEARTLLRDGWRITAIDISERPVRAVVRLTDGASERVVAGNDLAFAVYAAALRASALKSKKAP